MERRKFIKTALAGASAFTIIPRHVLGGLDFTAPSDQLTKAVIGVGGMGRGHMRIAGSKLLAVCDVDEKHLERALELGGPDVKGYKDFREVLQRDDIDIISMCSPNFLRTEEVIKACKAEKHFFAEKPISHTLDELKALKSAYEKAKADYNVKTIVGFVVEYYDQFLCTKSLIKSYTQPYNGLIRHLKIITNIFNKWRKKCRTA